MKLTSLIKLLKEQYNMNIDINSNLNRLYFDNINERNRLIKENSINTLEYAKTFVVEAILRKILIEVVPTRKTRKKGMRWKNTFLEKLLH